MRWVFAERLSSDLSIARIGRTAMHEKALVSKSFPSEGRSQEQPTPLFGPFGGTPIAASSPLSLNPCPSSDWSTSALPRAVC
jgi:hypothetical protein